MPPILAIFDLDGVIVSTDKHHRLAWQRLTEELGLLFHDEYVERTKGVDRMSSLKIVLGDALPRYTEAQLMEFATRKNGYYVDLIRSITPADLLPGSLDLLADLDAHGIRKAIGSASKNAVGVLERLGVAVRFDTIVTGHDYSRGKPAPDVFLTASTRLGIPPQRCVVFEDALAGIQAARAGGMHVIGVGREENLPGADRWITNLSEVRAKDIISLVNH